ncbi:alpha/beta fold hydrolase [Nocardia sp. NBC_01327]|uniref:alpha/beta fold hydrolase n=1 Tax=Nocardia sp. NBC_01327 TaxID=2903593 RepID=UPI002E11ACB1|nr:alpha/beta hydrolase [Nocardia sp. NBC_01327]
MMTNLDDRLPPSSATSLRAGSGEPLLLLHGGTSSWHCWETVAPLLFDDHDVFAPTLAGHAGMPDLPRPYTIAKAVDWLEKTMDEAGFETAHIAGNSLGGWLAMELARRGRARSVIAFSPAGAWSTTETRVPAIFRTMHAQQRLGAPLLPLVMRSPALRRTLMRTVCEHGDRITADQAILAARNALRCTALDDFPSVIATEYEPYGILDIPILIAWSEKDRIIPADHYAAGWRHYAPSATWRTLPDVGHVPMYDNPELVAHTILEWTAHATATRTAS